MKKSICGNNLIVFPKKPHGRILAWNFSILQNNWNIKNNISVYGGFKIVFNTRNKHTIQNINPRSIQRIVYLQHNQKMMF